MNVPSKVTAPNAVQANPDDGHRWRSQLLDAFAQLEAVAVEKCLELQTSVAGKATLAQRLGALRKQHGSEHSVLSVLNNCLDLIEVRNDLVHAKLHIIMLPKDAGGTSFLFRNVARPLSDGTSQCRIINDAGFKTLKSRVEKCCNEIRQLKAPTPTAPASTSE